MRHRSNRQLVSALALAATILPAGASADPLVTVTVGSLPPVSLGSTSSGGSGTSGTSGVGISVLPESGGKTTTLVEATVDEKPVVSVPLPSTGTPELPISKTPEVPKTPTVPTSPVGGGSSGGGSSGGSGSNPVASAADTATSTAAASTGAHTTAHTHGAGSSAGKQANARRHDASQTKKKAAGAAAAGGATAADTPNGSTRTVARPARRALAKTNPGGHSGPLAALGRDLPLPLPVPDWSKPIIALLLVLAAGFGLRWWLASRRAKTLEVQQRSLMRDLDVLQAALVPEVPATVGGLAVSVAYNPSEGPAAGGDFYDVFQLDEHRVAVMLGDVTGHGHEALQRAAQARYTLRAHLQEERNPRRALARSSMALAEPGFEQLATVALGVFDSRRGTLTYALAGHPSPIMVGVAAPDTPLACSSPPLGWDVPTGRRQRTVSLPVGARVCFFSDGLVEARLQAPRGARARPALLGPERLRRLLEGLPAQAGAPELLEAVREHTAATPDDMAACILTAREGRKGASLDLEELEVGEATLERGLLDSFLSSLGLSESARKGLTASVRARLRDSETAIVLVDRSKRSPRVRVTSSDVVPAPGDSVAPDLALRA